MVQHLAQKWGIDRPISSCNTNLTSVSPFQKFENIPGSSSTGRAELLGEERRLLRSLCDLYNSVHDHDSWTRLSDNFLICCLWNVCNKVALFPVLEIWMNTVYGISGIQSSLYLQNNFRRRYFFSVECSVGDETYPPIAPTWAGPRSEKVQVMLHLGVESTRDNSYQ